MTALNVAELYNRKQRPGIFLDKIKKRPYGDITISKRLQNSIETHNWCRKSASDFDKHKIELISASLSEKLRELSNFISSHYSNYLFYKILLHILFYDGVVDILFLERYL